MKGYKKKQMNLLIIEDDPIKLGALKQFIKEWDSAISIDDRMSYQSGLLALLENSYDLVLLDMQLPNYDIKSGEDGYKPRPVAGRDIMRELKRKKISTAILIVTQYEGFGEDGKFQSLDEWDLKLSNEFRPFYLQMIQYKPGSDSWKNQLIKYLKKNNSGTYSNH